MHRAKHVPKEHAPPALAPTGVAAPASRRAERLVSLDAFRGITIAAMILVNNPGTWKDAYGPLQHADWNGCTPADLIFPFFLFIVGVAITFSLAQRLRQHGNRARLLASIVRRTLMLFALGLLLNGFPSFEWELLRIPGVLQRIALCYFFAAIIVMTCSVRGQATIGLTLLLVYWALMKFVPVPGFGPGGLGPGKNLAGYLDTVLLSGHLLHHHGDPEGVLSTLPAIATTLSGVLAGHWLRSHRQPLERVAGLFVAGNAGVLLGLILNSVFPINKSLWSSSFVLFTSGVALNVLGLCCWLIDVHRYEWWAKPFVIYGTNPIVVYVLSSLVAKVLLVWRLPVAGGGKMHIKPYIYEHVFAPLGRPVNASLYYAMVYTLLWLGVAALLYRKRIFIKI
jgi:predicted acyltransferase